MKLAVSNIAWTNEEEKDIAKLLRDLGVKYIEIAPTKLWQDPTLTTDNELLAYKSFWNSFGIEIVAFQSMLFNLPEAKIFETRKQRDEVLNYLERFITIAPKLGAGIMVFGSPKNRQKGDLSDDQAKKIAIPFFRQIGKTAQANKTCFCIEPNPTPYNCDFVTTAQEGIDLVKNVNQPGFGLHLDIACMTLAGDDVTKSIKAAAPYLRHIHISSPMLEQVEARKDVKHNQAAQALKDIKYNGFVSIEMRPSREDENLIRVETAVRFAKKIYNS